MGEGSRSTRTRRDIETEIGNSLEADFSVVHLHPKMLVGDSVVHLAHRSSSVWPTFRSRLKIRRERFTGSALLRARYRFGFRLSRIEPTITVPPTQAKPVPTALLGLMQVNVVVPAGASKGSAVPLSVSIGGITTQPGVTLTVK
jgi:hypothetical protein